MVVFIRRQHLGFSVLLLCFVASMALVLWHGSGAAAQVFAPAERERVVVVVDPGHGGEDGGAVGTDGTVESRLNLEIALRVNDLLRFLGQPTVMTRREDVSIYSAGSETLRQKKVSDLQNRVALVNGLENGVLVSIHQNSLPGSPKTQGAQVFYNLGEHADLLARSVQTRLNLVANPGRAKTGKQIPSSIYLTKNVTAPAVIVECGFLSNSGETARLRDPAYQTTLAAAITAGICGCLAGEDVT